MKREKVLAILLIAVLVFGNAVSAFAGYEDYEEEDEVYYAYTIAKITLNNMGESEEVLNPCILKNIKGNEEAVVFDISNGGYIIVNINDLSVPEISFEGKNPYDGCENPVYNGPLNYYLCDNNEFYSIKSGEKIDVDNEEAYEKKPLEDKAEYVDTLLKNNKKRAKARTVRKYLSPMPQNWSYNTDSFCGALACAICMRYYYDNVNSNYVDSLFSNEIDLTTLMRGYVGYRETYKEDLVIGLNRYFSDRGVDNIARHNGSVFNFDTIINTVDRNRPAIVGIHNHEPYRHHWIIAWGYHYIVNNSNSQYVIVLDGWGNHQVFISVAEGCLREIVYFNK